MIPDANKLKRLEAVAKLYHVENMTQNQIAAVMKVSRPMISKLLAEAREFGVVTITINHASNPQQLLNDRLKEAFPIQKAHVVASGKNDSETNDSIAKAAFELCTGSDCEKHHFGVGWGSMIGKLIDTIENMDIMLGMQGEIFPLIGGIKASYRSYHTNEVVRILSKKTGLNASYLYLPALFNSVEEKKIFQQTEQFRTIEEKWDALNTALVNISNYPSTPDIATATRYGDKLNQMKAVGNFLSHFYNSDGTFIEPITNNILQISADQLKKANRVVALCGAIVRPESLQGALRTGLITDIVLSDESANAVLQL